MRKLVICLALLCAAPVAGASEDGPQDAEYAHCLYLRGATIISASRVDVETCLAWAGVPDPGEAAREEKSRAWLACLVKQAMRLDDGVSPAPDIARTLVGLCETEWRGHVGAAWMIPGIKDSWAKGVKKFGLDDGVRAVLVARKVRREGKR